VAPARQCNKHENPSPKNLAQLLRDQAGQHTQAGVLPRWSLSRHVSTRRNCKGILMATSTDDAPEVKYRTLRDGLPLSLLDDACLALRAPRYATCRACESTCPVKAIRVVEQAIELTDDCVRCGRCAAVCPMGALAQPGFVVAQQVQERATTITVDCWKVPTQLSADGAVRVPCLGGLSAGRMLELVASAGDSVLELIDRGWCASCSAGGAATHPAQGALTQVRALLQAAGLRDEKLPRPRLDPLPQKLMPTEIPLPVTETKLGRRGFFSMLSAKTAVVVDKVMPLSVAEVRRRRGFEKNPVPSTERERLLLGTALIAKAGHGGQPRCLFNRVDVSAACCNHQLCASICPTGALVVFEQGNRTELMFDTQLCIGCRECQVICPEDALSVLPNGYAGAQDVLPDQPIRLTSFGEKTCPECTRVYTEKGDDTGICPQCQKRRNLASSAFQSLFGPRR
jgi:ferredoxin